MTSLLGLVVLYLLGTLAIGLYAATRVKTATDFALAGRSLPLVMIITTTFATWFGSETVLGISAKRKVALAVCPKAELCVGFRPALTTDQLRETMKTITNKWAS